MSGNFSAQKEEAAHLVAADDLTNEQIAAHLGITDRTLNRWNRDPVFRSRVDAIVAEVAAGLTRFDIARKESRIAALQGDFEATEQIRRERAEQDGHEDIPGIGTGFVQVTYKSLGGGAYGAKIVKEHAFDAALFQQRRLTLQEVQEQLGQRKQRVEATHKVLVLDYGSIDQRAFYEPLTDGDPGPS